MLSPFSNGEWEMGSEDLIAVLNLQGKWDGSIQELNAQAMK